MASEELDNPAASVRDDRLPWEGKDLKYVILQKNGTKGQLKSLKNKERTYEWMCTACCCGMRDLNTVERHISLAGHRIAMKDEERKQKLLNLTTPTEPHVTLLNEFVLRTFEKVSASGNNQIVQRQMIAAELKTFVQKDYPDVNITLHGSSMTEFALISSDVNINLHIPMSDVAIRGCRNQERVPAISQAVVKILRTKTTLYGEVKEDYFAFNRIPRILFKHKESNLKVEIRINVGSPVALSLLLYCYKQLDPRVHQLGVLFRYWAKVCHVDCQEDGHYPGFIFVVMVIHYLQQRQPLVVPVLHKMFPHILEHDPLSSENEAGGHITEEVIQQVLDPLRSWKSPNSEPVGLLWHDLLKYYTVGFQVNRFAVSILQYELLKRENSQWGSSRLAVEDPVIPRSNIARAGGSDKVFLYLWSSLEQTMVYFNSMHTHQEKVCHPSGVGAGVPPSASVSLDDDSIVFARKTLAPVDTSVSENSFVQVLSLQSPKPSSSSNADAKCRVSQRTTKYLEDGASKISHIGSALDPSRCDVTDVSALVCTLQNLDVKEEELVTSSNSARCGDPSELTGTRADMTSCANDTRTLSSDSDHSMSFQYELRKEDFVYHSYPTSCLSCKRMMHNILNCPVERLPRWKEMFPKSSPGLRYLKAIKEAFMEFRSSVSPRKPDLMVREAVCGIIKGTVKSVFPDAELELFGSSANGFGSRYSDLDICLLLPCMRLEKLCKEEQNIVIEKVARRLRQSRGYQKIICITTARVPILKFCLPYYRQECDLSLGNRLALRNTKLIATYASMDDRIRLLGYALKYFAKVCDMGDASTGGLSSYAYILMIIHYLQRTNPPVLPCLQQIFATRRESVTIDGWNCYYFEDMESLVNYWPHYGKNTELVGELWLGFLRYFLKFNWSVEVVTIRRLEPLFKFDKWWMNKLMCIEDPFNLDHNLSANIGVKMRLYILERFYYALIHNSSSTNWKHIDHLMDHGVIVGNEKSPKYIICRICNHRGHRAEICPESRKKERQEKAGKESRKKERQEKAGKETRKNEKPEKTGKETRNKERQEKAGKDSTGAVPVPVHKSSPDSTGVVPGPVHESTPDSTGAVPVQLHDPSKPNLSSGAPRFLLPLPVPNHRLQQHYEPATSKPIVLLKQQQHYDKATSQTRKQLHYNSASSQPILQPGQQQHYDKATSRPILQPGQQQHYDTATSQPILQPGQQQHYDPATSQPILQPGQQQHYDPATSQPILQTRQQQHYDPATSQPILQPGQQQHYDPATPQPILQPGQQQHYDPATPQPILQRGQQQHYDTATSQPILQPGQQQHYDPATSQPILQPGQQQHYDPATSQPILQTRQQQHYDPATSQPILQPGQQQHYDPATSQPILQPGQQQHYDPATSQTILQPGQQQHYDPATSQPILQPGQQQHYDPATSQPILQPGQQQHYDPATSQPILQPGQQQHYDPATSQPILQPGQQQHYDPATSQPILQPGQQQHYDPATSQPILQTRQQQNYDLDYPILPVNISVSSSQQRQPFEGSPPIRPLHVPVSLPSRQYYGSPVFFPGILPHAVQENENGNLPSPGFPATAIPQMMTAPPLHYFRPNVVNRVLLPNSQSSVVRQSHTPKSHYRKCGPTPHSYQVQRPFQMPSYPMQQMAWPLQQPSLLSYSVQNHGPSAQGQPMQAPARLPPGTVSQNYLPPNEHIS